MKQKKFMSGILVIALLSAAAGAFSGSGCAAVEKKMERVKDPITGITNASPAETGLKALMAANSASAPVNPFSPLIAIIGQVAGAFLAGYGGAHVRIKRQDPVDAIGTGLAMANADKTAN